MFFKKKSKKIDFLSAHHGFVFPLIKGKKRKNNFWRRFFKCFFIFFGVLAVLTIIFSSVLIFKFAGIYNLANSGKKNLEHSVQSAKDKNFIEMLSSSKEAEKYFNELSAELEAIQKNLLVRNFNFAQEKFSELEYLIKSAAIISRSVAQAAKIGEELDNITEGEFGLNFSQFSSADKERILKLIYESGPDLSGAKANLDLALMNLAKIESKKSFDFISENIFRIKNKLFEAADSLSRLFLASQLLPELAGYPEESAFLVMFQNNTELRPTGGFLGTYGILILKNGEIIRFDTHDIYHMDMPLEALGIWQVVPPEPIAKYLNKNWYLRDSNWSPDWPSSARQIEWFFQKEDSLLPEKNKINNFEGNFNGVIAITPDIVSKLIELTGPVYVGNEEFNADNFTELLQYKVEKEYALQDIPSWERKEIIGDILEEIKIKLFDIPFADWPAVAEKISAGFFEKDILIFLHNEYLQKLIKDIGAGGEIKDVEGDYLMVVDANMAALKTDAVMKKSIKYELEEKADGLFARLRINYVHQGGYDWKTDDYKTYTRVYVPLGSRLIKSEGGSDIKVKEEFGKTSFGAYFTVKAGRSGSLYFEYKLPQETEEYFKNNGYYLYVQKQPGSKIEKLELDLNFFQNKVRSYEPVDSVLGGQLLEDNRVKWTTDLKTDKEFSIRF